MTKKLIINADDFGISKDINMGIIKSYTDGIVTDISIMAVGNNFDNAVSLLKQNNINEIGVHLTLTGQFKSLSKRKSITNKKGFFHKSFFELFIKILLGISKERDIYDEFKLQIEKVRNAGLKISHIDSHQHIHIFPPILKLVIKIMKEENINFIRFPKEKLNFVSFLKEPINFTKSLMLYSACFFSKNIIKKSHLKYNDYFVGVFHSLNLNKKDIYALINNIKDGITEMCCHPGYYREISKIYPYYKNCENELNLFCHNEIKEKIKNSTIQLCSHNRLK